MQSLVRQLMQDHRDMEASWLDARAVLQAVAQQGLATLADAQTQSLNRFAVLYGQHIVHEEGLAYPAAQAVLSATELHTMARDMMERRGVQPLPV